MLHPLGCTGTSLDGIRLARTIRLQKIAADSDLVVDALLQAAGAGHRKCMYVLLEHAGFEVPNHALMSIVYQMTRTDCSWPTISLGLALNQLLTNRQRRNIVNELLDLLVINGSPAGHLRRLLQMLGSECCTQQLNSAGPSRPVFKKNLPMMAVLLRQPECLRLALRHSAAVDAQRLSAMQIVQELSAEKKDEVSLILAWASSTRANIEVERVILEILVEFGSNLWTADMDGCLPKHRLTNFPLVESVSKLAPPESRVQLLPAMEKLMTTPRRLKSACRLVITQALGSRLEADVTKLGNLPTTLYAYLRFEDLRYGELERAPELGDTEDVNFIQVIAQVAQTAE